MYTGTQGLVFMTTDITEFHFVKGLPKREKSKVAKLFDVLEELDRVVEERGALIPQTMVAEILGISRQRVHKLVLDGRLDSIEVGGQRQVFTESMRTFAKLAPLKPGRPKLEAA